MNNGKLKDAILKSGIPLEVSVSQKLSKYDLIDWGELTYQREGKLFSTDIKISKTINIKKNRGLHVTFIIECKYKDPSHNWYFMNFPTRFKYSFREEVTNAVFDRMGFALQDRGLKAEEFADGTRGFAHFRRTHLFNLPKVNKGVEIHGKKHHPDSIRKALYQSLYGAMASQKGAIDHIKEMREELEYSQVTDPMEFHGIVPIASLVVPIIVTTANIYRFDEETRLEQIKNTDDITSLFQEQKGVVYYKQYTQFLIQKILTYCLAG